MTIGGWATFLISVGAFSLLFAWCMYKVLTTAPSKEKDLHGAFDISEIKSDDDIEAQKNKKR